MKQILSFIVATLSLFSAHAYDFFYDDIYYNVLSDSDCEVTFQMLDSSEAGNRTYTGDVVIPSQAFFGNHPYNVVKIGQQAFDNCKSLTSITIPSSVLSFGINAFRGCSSLKSVTLLDGDGTLSGYMPSLPYPFKGCPIETLYYGRFCDFTFDSSVLTSLSFGRSLKNIGSFICPNVSNLEFPETVESIGLFSDCKISSINIPESVKLLWGFCNVPLTSISLPKGLLSLGCLSGTNITSLELPETLEYLGNMCFNESPIKSIIVPKSVTQLSEAFLGNDIIESIIINSDVSSLGYRAFSGCTSLKNIQLPQSLTQIEGQTFMGCSSLQSITIPNSVETISYEAFYGCETLSEITLGFNVNVIAQDVFKDCTSLNKITSLNRTPPMLLSDTFEPYHYTQATLYGNSGMYWFATYWDKFKSIEIIDVEESGIISVVSNKDRQIVGRYNIDGITVDADYKGLVITHFSDGSVTKTINR